MQLNPDITISSRRGAFTMTVSLDSIIAAFSYSLLAAAIAVTAAATATALH